ncbi:MAG: PadR family transcriptional regulator [Candidatus Cybelea sp.]
MTSADAQRELFVLGLVRRKPASAYQLDKAMREHTPLYRSFSRGNVYGLIKRLAAAGLLEREPAAAKRGPQKTKALYRLSDAGERRFGELLRGVLLDVQTEDPALETALVLLGQLKRDAAAELLAQRARNIAAHERRLSRLLGDMRQRAGSAYLSASHTVHRLRSERRYLSDTIDLLRDPRWEPQWVLDDGPVVDPARKV